MRFIIIATFTVFSALVAPSYGQTTPVATTGIEVLLDNAANAVEQGHYDRAASELERALGIAPRNAEIWHLLGQVRLHQGRYKQAEAMAEKSRTLTGNNTALQQRNAYLIQVARELQGVPYQPNRQIQTATSSDLPINPSVGPRISNNVGQAGYSGEFQTARVLSNPIPFEPVLGSLYNEQTAQLIYDQYPPGYSNQVPLNQPQTLPTNLPELIGRIAASLYAPNQQYGPSQYPPGYGNQVPLNVPQPLPTNLPELIGRIGASLYAPNQQYGPSQYPPGYGNQVPLNVPQALPTNLPELFGRIGTDLLLQKLNRLQTEPELPVRQYDYKGYRENQKYKEKKLGKRSEVRKTKHKRKHKKKYNKKNKKGYRR